MVCADGLSRTDPFLRIALHRSARTQHEHQLVALQDRVIVNPETARQFHINAIDHLGKALALHRKAIDNHDQGDFTAAPQHINPANSVGPPWALSAISSAHC
jgi:hypothetical protein